MNVTRPIVVQRLCNLQQCRHHACSCILLFSSRVQPLSLRASCIRKSRPRLFRRFFRVPLLSPYVRVLPAPAVDGGVATTDGHQSGRSAREHEKENEEARARHRSTKGGCSSSYDITPLYMVLMVRTRTGLQQIVVFQSICCFRAYPAPPTGRAYLKR